MLPMGGTPAKLKIPEKDLFLKHKPRSPGLIRGTLSTDPF
jgi:hypothetical protein